MSPDDGAIPRDRVCEVLRRNGVEVLYSADTGRARMRYRKELQSQFFAELVPWPQCKDLAFRFGDFNPLAFRFDNVEMDLPGTDDPQPR
jgi:hypothetical protein